MAEALSCNEGDRTGEWLWAIVMDDTKPWTIRIMDDTSLYDAVRSWVTGPGGKPDPSLTDKAASEFPLPHFDFRIIRRSGRIEQSPQTDQMIRIFRQPFAAISGARIGTFGAHD
jgi:hypothetical protein